MFAALDKMEEEERLEKEGGLFDALDAYEAEQGFSFNMFETRSFHLRALVPRLIDFQLLATPTTMVSSRDLGQRRRTARWVNCGDLPACSTMYTLLRITIAGSHLG